MSVLAEIEEKLAPLLNTDCASNFKLGDILIYAGNIDIDSGGINMPDLSKGMKGLHEILILQILLKFEGYYKGEVDSSFGKLTEEAVLDYQIDNKIVDKIKYPGTVGITTWNMILKGVLL